MVLLKKSYWLLIITVSIVGSVSLLFMRHLCSLPVIIRADSLLSPDLVQKSTKLAQQPLPLVLQPLAKELQQLTTIIRQVKIQRRCCKTIVTIDCKTIRCRIGKQYLLVEDGMIAPATSINTTELAMSGIPSVAVAAAAEQATTIQAAGKTLQGLEPDDFEQYTITIIDRHTIFLQKKDTHHTIVVQPEVPINKGILRKATEAIAIYQQNSRQGACKWCTVDTRFDKQLVVRRQAR
ncbi:hypothetical protein M1466_00310 [Candidatus Dependentiae bacterium]|nr:hypothetical protein [Candidatus Dependentiae bacterium]